MIGLSNFAAFETFGSICNGFLSEFSRYKNAWPGKVCTVFTISGFLWGTEGRGLTNFFPLNPKPPKPLTNKPTWFTKANYFFPSAIS